VGGNAVRIGRESSLEIGVDREVYGGADDLQPFERDVERHMVVGTPHRPGNSRTRCGERLETKVGKQPGASGIPGVRNDEAAVLVELVEDPGPIRKRSHRTRIKASEVEVSYLQLIGDPRATWHAPEAQRQVCCPRNLPQHEQPASNLALPAGGNTPTLRRWCSRGRSG